MEASPRVVLAGLGAAAVSLTMTGTAAAVSPRRSAATVLHNGIVHTGVPNCPPAEAIAVGRDGRILAVGTDSELLRNLGRSAPNPPGGTIERDAAGEPTGLLKDDAVNLVQQVIPPLRCSNRTLWTDSPAPTTLEPGKQADLVLVDRDVTRIAPAEIRDTKALLTMVGGEIVHEGPAAVPPAIAARKALLATGAPTARRPSHAACGHD